MLQWEAEWGEHEASLREMAEQTGRIPDPLLRKPTLAAENVWLYDAYLLLSRSRQIGMGEFFIPLTEIVAYCQLIDLQYLDDRLLLTSVISHVDAVLLSERAKAKAKA